MSLAEKRCVPCRGGVPPLKGEELSQLAGQVSGWQVVNEHHIEKQFTFPDFKTALDFVNQAGAIAEAEGHHPDLFLSWGKVGVKTWTHKIDGLTESDFILAAKIDAIQK
jgi:4a-hydroxytetrahydrobiopterin dehydratase